MPVLLFSSFKSFRFMLNILCIKHCDGIAAVLLVEEGITE
jgi:hypothetical protein